jgi:predicted metalloprotease with PDZ domain
MKTFWLALVLCISAHGFGQTNSYEVSFENAVHHEAEITAIFTSIKSDTLSVRMSRTSPGRYALHEFAKNVYNFKAFDSEGNVLQVIRPNPYEWKIVGHDKTIQVNYTLFANRGDGTYSQIDETHAHLNMPATFLYAPKQNHHRINVRFNLREDLNWKIATQLPETVDNTFRAPNLSYFMDSPTELSNHHLRSFDVSNKKGTKQNIRLALHHNGTEEETDLYFEQIKKVVLAEKEVYGELPTFDYGSYTFLACYIPNASGDGMEHRNSTILTSKRSLSDGGMEKNMGTVSHEFFHAWNVERIRPKSLKPFDFEEVNMSGELWFAEGFTSYYTNLILCRAGLLSPTDYVEGLSGTFNYVWNSPGRTFFNPIEMSFQAPFVDAATSVDPVNRKNTFISYYSYGSVLGLALDLSLRKKDLNLDDYMKLVWENFGKNEDPYTINGLKKTLAQYAGADFSNDFFDNYIYKSGMPDYENLFDSVGVILSIKEASPYFGAKLNTLTGLIEDGLKMNSPAYKAGLNKGDVITAINNLPFSKEQSFDSYISQFKVGEVLTLNFKRFDLEKTTTVTLEPDPTYSIILAEKEGADISSEVLMKRKEWLKIE